MTKAVALSDPSNGGLEAIEYSMPYMVKVKLEGSSDMLFHRYNVEAVIEKGKAAKGSKAKKTDDLESYVYRDDANHLCIPGEYLRMAVIGAAKFKQDPRSPRKSAQDLFKAAVVNLTPLASMGKVNWDYEDRRRAVIHGNAIPRVRPAIRAGWQAEFEFQIILPEYIDHIMFRETVEMAGRLIGLGDLRPTYGRFGVVAYK